MDSFEQLFEIGDDQSGDLSTIHNPPTTLQHSDGSALHPAISFRVANSYAEDPALFDIPRSDDSSPFGPRSLPSPINPTIEPSNVEFGMRGLPKVVTDTLPRFRQQYGQITPPDEMIDFNSPKSTSNDIMLAEMTDYMAEDAPSSHGQRTGEKRTNVDFKAEPSGPSPKKAKRGRKSNKVRQGEPNTEEDTKRERFLERNRVAASKCRQRKKEWMGGLENRARELQNQRTHLSAYVASLREEVLYLKDEMLKHNQCGCTKIREYLGGQAEIMSPSANLHKILANIPVVSNTPNNDIYRPDTTNSRTNSTMFDSPLSGKTDQELHSLLVAAMPKKEQELH